MKKVIIIGTIHLNWTPKEELWETLSNINPDQVLVELSDEELNLRPRNDSIRDEMFFAYDWAIQHNKLVNYFDTEDSPLKEGVTGKEPEFMEHELRSKELLKNYSWKDLNKMEPWKISEVKELEDKITEKYFDIKKSKEREQKMLGNILSKLIEGTNVVIIGAGHLSFFEKEIPGAILPFRN
ncbi:MAG: hypothetical protein K9M10_00005 [Candidatus Pacebacteria bacterium]|nr:hypothetical protein [Candidatus Paceibacterota bacterium]MCF7856848.1 hypothetical protein [Candidatus Paceibacterota bacterium]